MSRYQGTILPSGLEDKKIETETRKSVLDLLKKINEIYSELTPSSQTVNGGPVVTLRNGTMFTPYIEDYRSTSGTVDRTETTINLDVGQTAVMNWALGVTGGVARTVTLVLSGSSASRYMVSVVVGTAGVTDSITASSAILISSNGVVAGGTTIDSSAITSGRTREYVGWVKRII